MMMNKITKKLAVYEYTSWGSCGSFMAGVQIVRDDDTNDNDLIRVSEWKDVEFDAIPVEEVMPEILAALDNEMAVEEEKHNITMARLRSKKQELLAITLQPGQQSKYSDLDIRTQEVGDGTWNAWYFGEGNFDGLGGTEQEAIDDLIANSKMQDEH